MPSSKGSSNSNKTAHVMNLLRKNAPAPHAAPASEVPAPAPAPAPAAAPVSAPAAQPAPAPAPAPQTAPIITALNADSEISLQIRDALEEELARETENEASALPVAGEDEAPEDKLTTEPLSTEEAMPKPAKEPQAVKAAPEPVIEKLVNRESVPSEQSEEKSAFPKEEPAPAAEKPDVEESAAPVQEVSEYVSVDSPVPEVPLLPIQPEPFEKKQESELQEPMLVNVMQQIIEDKADKYIGIFDVCRCSHCRKDVIALALNQMPPKYVVMSQKELLLKRDMYEVRYNCEAVAQLMQACQKVKDNPHHNN